MKTSEFNCIKNQDELEKYILSDNLDYSWIFQDTNPYLLKLEVISYLMHPLSRKSVVALETHPLFPKPIKHKQKRYYFSEDFSAFQVRYGKPFIAWLHKNHSDSPWLLDNRVQDRFVLSYFNYFLRT